MTGDTLAAAQPKGQHQQYIAFLRKTVMGYPLVNGECEQHERHGGGERPSHRWQHGQHRHRGTATDDVGCGIGVGSGEEGLLDLLLELRDAPVDVVLEWPESAAVRVRNASARGGLNVKLRRKKGWYLATGGIKLDDVSEVSLEELMTMPATAGGRFVRLPSGDYIEIEKRVKRALDVVRLPGVENKLPSELSLGVVAVLILGSVLLSWLIKEGEDEETPETLAAKERALHGE